ncbi:IclR family transcriptional regulator [Alloalcanivorax sp. C16-2]|uniref:IclR family transcriptional regulator n=1 Tax=Alloalcanivorax TaxID=3020832 RepID=UPI0019338838|nr:IclR family transcriptional regulator [Alloalcanivorax marinus]MBL7251190.1 IclR family transcriptional regulator [Alloalcanivorax marinus]
MAVNRREKGSSITRVLGLIERVSREQRPISPADLSHLLDIPKPSVHRLLQQLEKEDFLRMDSRGLWIPGPRLYRISLDVFQSDSYRLEREAILNTLAARIGETCSIAIPMQLEMMYSDRAQANWPLHIHLPVGTRTPVWCTASGKLYLALLPEERRRAVVASLPLTRMARNTFTDERQFLDELAAIAEREESEDNEEFIDGMVAVAVPIRDPDGQPFAFLNVHAPVIRTDLATLRGFLPMMREAAAALGAIQ